MRTTLALDDDVLDAARVLARQKGTSLGAVISGLARETLRSRASQPSAQQRSGLPLLPLKATGALVDLQLVNQLRDEQPSPRGLGSP